MGGRRRFATSSRSAQQWLLQWLQPRQPLQWLQPRQPLQWLGTTSRLQLISRLRGESRLQKLHLLCGKRPRQLLCCQRRSTSQSWSRTRRETQLRRDSFPMASRFILSILLAFCRQLAVKKQQDRNIMCLFSWSGCLFFLFTCELISGDPFKAPEWYLKTVGSQRQWERQHGHTRERGGWKLGCSCSASFFLVYSEAYS